MQNGLSEQRQVGRELKASLPEVKIEFRKIVKVRQKNSKTLVVMTVQTGRFEFYIQERSKLGAYIFVSSLASYHQYF